MRISDWSSDVCSSDLFDMQIDRHLAAVMEQGGIGDGRSPGFGLRRLVFGAGPDGQQMGQIGRAHVCTPVTNAQLVCRLLLEKKKYNDLNTYTNAQLDKRHHRYTKQPEPHKHYT